MIRNVQIPNFTLFGETENFPDVVHYERISKRATGLDWTISAHRHMQLAQLFVFEEGHANAQIDGQRYDIDNKVVIFVPARVVHRFSFAPGMKGAVLSFPVSILESIAPSHPHLMQSLSRPFIRVPDEQLERLIDSLVAASQAAGTYRTQVVVGLAHAVLASVAQLMPPRTAQDDVGQHQRVVQFDSLIIAHIADGWGPSDFADAMAISTGHLGRLCRTAKGISTSAYIASAVMEEACRLLAFTQISVAEVGYRVSYADPSYFSRRFRKVRGVTPQAYRKQVCG